MNKLTPITIVNVGYRATHYWVISAGTSRLLLDIGWPGMLGMMKANLKKMGIPLHEIRYALATHYHIDHAGLGEEMKREGVPLLVLDVQEIIARNDKPHLLAIIGWFTYATPRPAFAHPL